MSLQTVDHQVQYIKSEGKKIELSQKNYIQPQSESDPLKDKSERDSGINQQVKGMEKPISKPFMTILLLMMLLGTYLPQPTCYQYPRYFVSLWDSNYIMSMDMHFESDLLVFVGHSNDYNINRNGLCLWCNIPVVAAISIAGSPFKWTLAAVEWKDQSFSDVEISNDGAKALVAGSGTDGLNKVIVWVLNTADGSIIRQKMVQVIGSGSTASPLTLRYYKQALITSTQYVIYLLMRTISPNTSIYLAKFDYAASSVSPLWSLQTDPTQATLQYSQITFGGSSSSILETSVFVVVPVGTMYQISRIAEDGTIQWSYEFPLNTTYTQKEVFIEYALNPVSGGDNTLVIANNQYNIVVMKISQTELTAAAGPILSSLKLYKEPNYNGVTSAIYVKPSSTLVYLLKKLGSYYYIGYFSTTELFIIYKQAFYNCDYDRYFPRGLFKDETDYFAALNCANDFDYGGYRDCNGNLQKQQQYIGTSYFGGLIFASNQILYQSCFNNPNYPAFAQNLTDESSSLVVSTTFSGSWVSLAASVAIQLTNDLNEYILPFNISKLTLNVATCTQTMQFINYVSGASRQFNVKFSQTQQCLSGTARPILSYSLENGLNSGSLDPMSFMNINPSNGIISISDSSFPSNFNYQVTAKGSEIPNGILESQDYTLYDLRLYFADLQNFTMLSGEIMSNITTLYNNVQNPLKLGALTLNGTSLPLPPYFIQIDCSSKILTIAPTSISHFGMHTLTFRVSDSTDYVYEHVLQVNVRNRAPYFSTNITNANYSAIFNSITTFTLPTRVSPDLGNPMARIISSHSFVTIVSSGTDIILRVHAQNLLQDINVHNVSLEVFIDNYPNTTEYWINLRINNTLPKFDMPLADQDMGLYWNKNYKLPYFSDPDGGSINVNWSILPVLDFIKFDPTTNNFMIHPMEVNMIGQYSIIVTLTDQNKGSQSEQFTLRVHRPPMFSVQMKKFFSMKVGSVFKLDLPLFETYGIGISHSSLPDFATIDNFQYTFKPTTLPHLGIFLIKGRLQNVSLGWQQQISRKSFCFEVIRSHQ